MDKNITNNPTKETESTCLAICKTRGFCPLEDGRNNWFYSDSIYLIQLTERRFKTFKGQRNKSGHITEDEKMKTVTSQPTDAERLLVARR